MITTIFIIMVFIYGYNMKNYNETDIRQDIFIILLSITVTIFFVEFKIITISELLTHIIEAIGDTLVEQYKQTLIF